MYNATTRRASGRLGLAVAGLTIGGLALAGCSGGGADPATEKTEIRFLYATGDETWNSVVDSLVETFNEQSETTTVALDPLPAGTDYPTALKTVDATGSWPAIVDMRDTLTYASAGKLAPIPTEVTDLLEPSAFAAAEDGNVYTVPYSALNGELGLNIIYNRDYFEDHDLEVPETYDDFIALLDAIKANGDVPLATAAAEIWPSDQLWKPLAAPTFAKYSNDGGFWNVAAEGGASMEDLREPLERLQNIMDNYVLEGWQSTADAQTTTLLVNGQAVMATSSAGIGRLMDIQKVDPDFNAGLFIIPDDDGKINVLKNSVVGDTAGGLAISSQAAADKKEYASAVEFLKYFYSVDAANLMEEKGWISPNILASDEVKRNTEIPGAEDYFALLDNPNLVWYENSPTMTTFSAFGTFFRQARVEMQDGQTTLDQMIAKTQAEFDAQVAAAG
ncbi:MAG TPA: ABC transporter substrate-binding protein [Microbacterium sp.]|uniref:ABC transporter substrate-binding protein n=1 Tax=Microbacterium sp. TaxID=51671 RepID=UPI002B5EB583|nr:ABC transporter substrate-binding protein [Microbacterium sp.]HWI30083.1 ABC transporter substrate-binding protein [Microbacterium sp.]